MKREKKEKCSARTNRIGIKWKMFAILIIFVTTMTLVILFFQVVMLHPFYQKTKFNEMAFTESMLLPTLGDERELEQTSYICADSYHNMIWVFRIDGTNAEPLVEVNGSGDSAMRFLRYRFSDIYGAAQSNGGSYIAVISSDLAPHVSSSEVVADNFGKPEDFPLPMREQMNI